MVRLDCGRCGDLIIVWRGLAVTVAGSLEARWDVGSGSDCSCQNSPLKCVWGRMCAGLTVTIKHLTAGTFCPVYRHIANCCSSGWRDVAFSLTTILSQVKVQWITKVDGVWRMRKCPFTTLYFWAGFKANQPLVWNISLRPTKKQQSLSDSSSGRRECLYKRKIHQIAVEIF